MAALPNAREDVYWKRSLQANDQGGMNPYRSGPVISDDAVTVEKLSQLRTAFPKFVFILPHIIPTVNKKQQSYTYLFVTKQMSVFGKETVSRPISRPRTAITIMQEP
ncbi:MAG: hypothetical protein PUD16_03435 [bacterium]|nr:hypothetical protein [bacterium]